MQPQKIVGIHNYCDRWCERCTFTSRCAVYEEKALVPSEELDLKNKAFWESLGKNFIKAQEFLKKAAAEHGLDLDAVADEAEKSYRKREELKKESRKHPLGQLSLDYSEAAREWLKTQPGMLDRLEHLKTELHMGIETSEGARRQTEVIKESLEVIQWYLAFIHAKISRALIGKLAPAGRQDDNNEQRDCDGSAKIALIAVDRSVHAWSSLFQLLPEQEDEFLRILAMLEKIKTMIIHEFPDAQSFIRPGFDE